MRGNGSSYSNKLSLKVGGRIIKRFVLVLCIFFSCCVIFASGKKESGFTEIDAYIEAKDYNVALELLEKYLLENPDDFDNAQKRLTVIMEQRSEYNILAEELINVILNEPTNDKKKLDMIAQLESMEKNPNEANVNFIRQTKEAAQFTYFRAMFEQYMEEGIALVQNKQYSQAIDKFSEGFTLYRDDFYDRSYGDEIEDPVTLALSDIVDKVEKYKTLQAGLTSSFETLKAAISSGNITNSESSYIAFNNNMQQFAEQRNSIAQDGWLFSDTFSTLQGQYPELTEASFLPFVYRFTLGRVNDPQSGILGALDCQWNEILEELKPLAFNAASTKMVGFTSAVSSVSQSGGENGVLLASSHENERTALAETSRFVTLADNINDLYNLRLVSSDVYAENIYPEYKSSVRYALDLTTQVVAMFDNADSLSSLIADYEGHAPTLEAVAEIRSDIGEYSLSMQKYVSDFSQIASVATDATNSSSNAYSSVSSATDWKDAFDVLIASDNDIATTATSFVLNSWTTLASYLASGATSIASEYTKQYSDALSLYTGDEDSALGAYPAECIEVINTFSQTYSIDRSRIVSIQTLLSGVNSQQVTVSTQQIASAIAEMNRVQIDSNDLLARAQQQVLLAERAKNEAELRYTQAVAALNADEFQTARDTIQRARAKYNESLELQEDSTLRTRSDTILQDLGLEINKAENELVVREVRQLKTQAKNAYYSGNFEQAQNMLVQAQTRWSTTNVEEDLEITNLLTLVGTALSMKTGRIIPVTAPLYPEMSQILSIANQYYDEGKDLLEQNKRTEGLAILNEAKQKLRELQLVYPLNQEASLLTLRIDQLIDPVTFTATFKQKYDAARTDYKVATTQQSAYTDLLDLAEINPNYPGLKDFIYQVEIEIGVRPKPVDRSGIIQSNRLTTEAQAIVDANSRDEIALNQALAKVDEAIKLNPDNEAAMILKDRIQTNIGGQAVSVLDSESEALYQKAVQELQKGNTIEASALVTQLLANKQNQRSSKVLDLQKRVQSLL